MPLKKLLELTPRLDLSGLREDLAEFSLPFKDALLEKWSKDQRSISPNMVRYLKRLDALWES